jgi:hypothetical protein
MISWISATILFIGFLALLQAFGIIEKSRNVGVLSGESFNIIRVTTLSDEDKEKILQKNAKRLFRLFISLTIGGVVAIALPLAILYVADRLEWLSMVSVFSVAISSPFIVMSSIITIGIFFLHPGKTQKAKGYSLLERSLHYVAFNTWTAQVSLADLEDRLFSKNIFTSSTNRPVFIAALPRAGTTLLLECLTTLPEFASHCYRDMPFVIVPCLWNRFSSHFQQIGSSRERAHGDGMHINFDSPEALEEILWKCFWHHHYQSDRIIPWQKTDNEEFSRFFSQHMQKIILLRCGKDNSKGRYISKNNLSIARTGMLKRIFPDSLIVVPFRQPVQHAASLLEQHQNFLRIHNEDAFASEYMRQIGHYDFGANLRPVDFDGWMDQRQSQNDLSLSFWIEYWVAAYNHLLKTKSKLLFIDYEGLCNHPDKGLEQLADAIGIEAKEKFLTLASMIRVDRKREICTKSVHPLILTKADQIYSNLKKIAWQ